MRYSRQLRKMVIAVVLGLLSLAIVAWVFLSQTPYGYYDLTAMQPGHDREDTVLFSNGSVTMKSCCGDLAMGSYSRAPDGSWRWHYKHGPDDPLPSMDLVVEPGVLGIKVLATNSIVPYFLKRKLGTPHQHEVAAE